MGRAYVNGEFVDEHEAFVPTADRGFLYGDGLFETMRAYDGRVFRLRAHLERLFSSAGALRIPLGTSTEELEEAVTTLLGMNELHDAYVRLTLTRGWHPGHLGLNTGEEPTLVIHAREYHGYPRELYAAGMRLTVGEAVRHTHSLIGRHKTLNYLENLVARDAARAAGFDEVLFLDESGCVTECATSNLFFIRDGELHTPSSEMNLLPGITRAVVMELASWNGRKTLERKWHFEEFRQADEVFLTNSLMEIMPVREVLSVKIGTGVPGEVTCELARAYHRAVAEECGG